jgi:hypothetical protein
MNKRKDQIFRQETYQIIQTYHSNARFNFVSIWW